MIILLLLGKLAWTNLIKLCNYFQRTWKIYCHRFEQFWEVITQFVFVHAILPKSRRMIIDCQLKSLLDNCLEPKLVGFGWADVLGLSFTYKMLKLP